MRSPEALWLPYRTPREDARVRLVCFPYAGGGASAFRGWQEALGPEVEVLAVQAPGREQRLSEPPLRSVAALVEAALPVLAPHLERPFALLGHSLGALVAWELARELDRRGGPAPVRFVASGSRAPHAPPLPDPIHVLRGAAFRERLRELGGTPPQVLASEELMGLFTPMLLADFEASETYRAPLAPLPVPVLALAAPEDPEVPLERAAAWEEQTTAGFALRTFAGGHFFLHERRDEVLAAVRAELLAP